MATLQTLYNHLSVPFDITPSQILHNNTISSQFDKFYPVSNQFLACKFCEELYPQLVKAACGCTFCTRCLYNELPSIPISRCPSCSLYQNYSIQTRQKVAQFNFSPSKPSISEENLAISQQIKVLELYPLSAAQEVKSEQVYCRNHRIFGGSCEQVLDCDFQSFSEHLSSCVFEPSTPLPLPISPPKSSTLLAFNNLYTQTTINLFQNQTISTKFVPPHRAPVIFHLIVRNLILQEFDFSLPNQKFANLQIIAFPNPLEASEIDHFVSISAGLRVTFPDGSTQFFELWCTPEQLRGQIMRFYLRIEAQQLGKYQFDLRYSSGMKNGIQIATKKISQKMCCFRHSQSFSVEKLISDDFYQVFRHRLQIGAEIVQKGVEIAINQNSDVQQLVFNDIDCLMCFAAFSSTLTDALSFIIALKSFCAKSSNSRLIVSTTLIELVGELMDRFQTVYSVQKASIDLIQFIVKSQADMNIMSLKAPGLFGRLRRIKHNFDRSEAIEDLLNSLFRVSAVAMNVDVSGGVQGEQ